MDWLAFLEKKITELANTGHIMDDETFITHLLNSLPQAEYKGTILAIKEKLRRSSYDLAEIEQLLEDKYQSMKYVKGWEEEEDDYALFASPAKKKGHKKQFKGRCGYCGEFGHKAVSCPNKKSNQKEGSKDKSEKRRHKNLKRTVRPFPYEGSILKFLDQINVSPNFLDSRFRQNVDYKLRFEVLLARPLGFPCQQEGILKFVKNKIEVSPHPQDSLNWWEYLTPHLSFPSLCCYPSSLQLSLSHYVVIIINIICTKL